MSEGEMAKGDYVRKGGYCPYTGPGHFLPTGAGPGRAAFYLA